MPWTPHLTGWSLDDLLGKSQSGAVWDTCVCGRAIEVVIYANFAKAFRLGSLGEALQLQATSRMKSSNSEITCANICEADCLLT